ncbi:BlaI/MecI/CopY family transcriptional regulator, partial [Streptomyces sp. GbtcB7]|uniref:BlaI/MecI/CopY family transcriptional regulator n=1 Tax=Streptomyces sp. GbtcB7 TaxID=2824752 RepID=UPI001C304889
PASGSAASTVRDLLARLVDVGVAERVGRAWAAVVRRTRATPRAGDRQADRPTGGRRRVLLVAAAVATAVIVGGALWPSGEGERPAAAA